MSLNETLLSESLSSIETAASLDALNDLRVSLLGKKGRITEQLKTLGTLPADKRKAAGEALNVLKQSIAAAIEMKQTILEKAAIDARLANETHDITLPPRPEKKGRIHPITQVTEELTAIFTRMGFSLAEGPDVEDEYHNFTALNFPENHPARQMHDTFFLNMKDGAGGKHVLRTHTSPVQVRAMKGSKPPFRLVIPGTTYRCDSDQTHTPMFHQLEALVIDKDINMGHLKGCIEQFLREFFETEVPIRLRPSFFPFTEPSAEVDIGCSRQNGELKIGAGNDWLEVLGCGMVHPNVLKNCGLDPNEWQGFAFGCGIDRLAMLKYGIPDLRTFFESDARWLDYYGFGAFDRPGS